MYSSIYSIIGCDLRVEVESRGAILVLLKHSDACVIAGGLDRKRQQLPALNMAQN
jgi:hypothetical protein